MGWLISRQQATSEPAAARRKVLALLGDLDAIPDAEPLLLELLVDAILMVESYRGARHQIAGLPELQRSVDALLRELAAAEKIKQWTAEEAKRPANGSRRKADKPAAR